MSFWHIFDLVVFTWNTFPNNSAKKKIICFELFELGTKLSERNTEALTLNVEIFASKWHIHFVIQLKDLELVIEMSQMS